MTRVKPPPILTDLAKEGDEPTVVPFTMTALTVPGSSWMVDVECRFGVLLTSSTWDVLFWMLLGIVACSTVSKPDGRIVEMVWTLVHCLKAPLRC